MPIYRLALLAVAPFLLAQAPIPAPPPATVQAARILPRVALDTSAGRIVIELDTARAPVTATNFLRYADQRRLDGVRFYRTAKRGDKYGFVQFGASADAQRLLPPIKHEPTTQTGLTHTNGVISVARHAPGTARGDFTISVGDQRFLDADPAKPGDNLGFAAFGRVVEGMEVVERILDAPIDPEKLENGAFKGEVPVTPVLVRTARRVAN